MSIRLFYDRWPQYNRRIVEVVRDLSPEQLALRPASEHWPVWAIVAHMAGTRVYWLCGVLGEPGADTTPFPDPMREDGWEDHPDEPRGASDLVTALETTFAILDGCLDRWTPSMLEETVVRRYGDQEQLHSRTSILQRMLTHDAYHCGEVSQTLGVAGLEPFYIWRAD